MTDPSGVYRIAGLPSGEYLVRVSEQLVQVDKKTSGDDVYANGSLMMTYYPSATSVEDAQPVTVIEGSESTGIDIRLPQLTPHAISGKVFGPNNEPGASARIRIDRTDEVEYGAEEYDDIIYSDSEGNWRITGVPAGEYVISISGPLEFGTKEDPRQLPVAPRRFNVRVDGGDVVVPDVKLSAGAAISGKITLDGKPPEISYGLPLDVVSADVEDAVARAIPRQRSRHLPAMRTILVSVVVCLWILTSPIKFPAQIDPDPERRTEGSTVRGTVTYSDTGRPTRQTSVHLINNDSGEYSGHAVTNGRGQFVMERVTAGRYILYADLPGVLRPGHYARNMGPVNSQLRLNAKRDLFTEVVVNGTDSVEVKVQVVRGGVITGRVLTEDDQPVVDAEINLLKRENDKWIPELSRWRGATEEERTRTDAGGVYRIAGLEAGDYIVRVSEPTIGYDRFAHADDAYSDGSLMVTYYPSATSVKEAQPVTVVEGGESSGVDVRLAERIPRTISGTITYGPDDAPGSYIGILVERTDEAGFVSSGFDTTSRADDNGNWVVRGVPAGNYVLRFSGAVRTGSGESARHVYIAPKKITVTIGNEDVALNTKVETGAIVHGSIKFEGPPPDSIRDLDLGVVLAGQGSERPLNNPSRRSDPNYKWGYFEDNTGFEIRELATGKYWFVVSGFDPYRYYVKSVTRKGLDLAQSPFTLVNGADFGDVLVTFGADMASIEGQVSNLKPKTPPNEAKTSAADVVVMLAPANDATRRFSRGLLPVHPDAQGRFSFTCGPGEYFVAVFTRRQREKLTMPITEDFFKQDNQKFQRVKVRAGEKVKGLMLPIGDN
jgi:hypothetical protein